MSNFLLKHAKSDKISKNIDISYLFFMFKRLFLHVDDRFSLAYDKKKYENILEDPSNNLWRNITTFVVFLVILSILILIFESIWDFWVKYKFELFVADFLISTVFLYEYLYRFLRAKKKFKFVKWYLNIVDVLSFLPFFLWLVFAPILSAEVLKVFRLARVFRILKLAKHIPVIVWFIKALRDYKSEYKWISILFIIVLTIISVLIYHVEHFANPDMFWSIPDAFWWAIVTMTTVWYWDMYPITNMGRIIWSMLIILWPVLLAVVSAVTILVFMDVVERWRIKKEKKLKKKCPRCAKMNKMTANYCIKCGEKLN